MTITTTAAIPKKVDALQAPGDRRSEFLSIDGEFRAKYGGQEQNREKVSVSEQGVAQKHGGSASKIGTIVNVDIPQRNDISQRNTRRPYALP